MLATRGETQVAPLQADGGKTKLYLMDSLDAQHLHNTARNIEIAVWLLSNRRNAAGQALLLAEVVTEKYRRAVISDLQNLAGGTFLQFLPVR